MKTSLKERTQALVRDRPRTVTIADLAEATGLKPRWIQAFVSDQHGSFCVDKVETLYVYLAGRELFQ
jgi:hypothetical protein